MATARSVLERVTSICLGEPFQYALAPEPFDFTLVPEGAIDGACRVEIVGMAVRGGFSWSEEHWDEVAVSVARSSGSDPVETYRGLLTEASSLVAAIARDGSASGEFGIVDSGRRPDISRVPGSAYQVMRVTVPVTYMTTL